MGGVGGGLGWGSARMIYYICAWYSFYIIVGHCLEAQRAICSAPSSFMSGDISVTLYSFFFFCNEISAHVYIMHVNLQLYSIKNMLINGVLIII